MTDELDLRLSTAFRSLDLPAAGPGLVDTLEGLRSRRSRRGADTSPRRWLAPLAAAASIAVAIVLVYGQLQTTPFGPMASPTPVPTPTPTISAEASSEGWPAYTVATLLPARAAGELHGEQVFLVGWWTDLRRDVACGTPSTSPLIAVCGDGQFGLTEDQEPIGTWDGDAFVPVDGPSLTPLLPAHLPTPGLGRSLIGLRDEQGNPHPPVQVSVVGRFDSPLAEACPEALRQACRDRFVIDEIIWAEVGTAIPTANPSATAPAPDDPPPASWPQLVGDCRIPPTSLEPGDAERVEIVSNGWLPVASVDVQPWTIDVMDSLAPKWVYVAVTEPDVPLSPWTPDPAGSERRFRWMGQAVCIGWDGMSGAIRSTVPGTTYELWSDGERVPLEVFPPGS